MTTLRSGDPATNDSSKVEGSEYSRVRIGDPAGRPSDPASLLDMVAACLSDVVEQVSTWYPPGYAAGWDRVGCVLGDPRQTVHRVLLAVDPVPQVAEEALRCRADLVLTHHPLFLHGVHALTDDIPGAAVARTLIKAGIALLTVHTNADVAPDGVNDALAAALGLTEISVLLPEPERGEGVGMGRVGRLPSPLAPAALGRWVADRLPATAAGVRVAIPPTAERSPVGRVAVLAGAGDSLLDAIAPGVADAVITSDCRHHRVLDAVLVRGLCVVDVAHAAAEAPWLPMLAERLRGEAGRRDWALDVVVSGERSDPWSLHVPAIRWEQQ